MTDDELQSLEALCGAATPGPWESYFTIHGDAHVTEQGRGLFGAVAAVATIPEDYGRDNAAFIAAANPSVVLKLVREVRALREENASLQAETGWWVRDRLEEVKAEAAALRAENEQLRQEQKPSDVDSFLALFGDGSSPG